MQFTTTELELIRFVNRKAKIWVVGGAVRDLHLGRESIDKDFVTNAPFKSLVWELQQAGFELIPDQTALDHGIVRIVDKDTKKLIDLANTRKDVWTDGRHATVELGATIEEDLARRDFTINAMAAEVNDQGQLGPCIDLPDSLEDIRLRKIRFVGNPEERIQEDALRMIRACRFMALSDMMTMTPETLGAIRKHAASIKNISSERIRDEIIKALGYPHPSWFFRSMHQCGLLGYIFPDLILGVGFDGGNHHKETIFDHLLYVLDASVPLTTNPLLRLAALCHDIAKPHVHSFDAEGRVHFYKHEVEGARIVKQWMKSLKFSNADIEYVSKLVYHHQWRFEDNTKQKTVRKWLQTVGKDTWRDLVTLRCADRRGNMTKQDKPMITTKMFWLINTAEQIIAEGLPLFKEDLAIDGQDLIALGLKPSPQFQEIFANLIGIVVKDPKKNTKEWLSDYVKRVYIKI
jgi:tRNA nucleotidyltransferase (CCA-adding enzyme)